ncbi:hypothetical protein AMS68_004661 [Peltaster fructicola]|uniref:LYC1 C-terminal domain-containing protein n=1 Tax=Peltaster fructicola TaxID=286661 RepID=A0A6H0XWP5_9PEZI|nr:hypothetical protein AMS68_004661 [Peltaster fructicola]
MASEQLPNVDSADVFLAIGTPQEHQEQLRYNSAEWRGPFDLKTYLRREELFLDQDLTRAGGLVPWMLFYQPDRKGPRKILCGCETIDKKAFVAKNGEVDEVVCNGVASVFCPAEHRGKGYAGRLIADLAARLADERALESDRLQKVKFSVLYSDIGKDFYARRGWHVHPSAHISLKPGETSRNRDLPDVQLLQASEVYELCSAEIALLKSSLSALPSSKTTVAILPDVRTMKWHHARSDFLAKELLDREIVNRGAKVVQPDGQEVWCVWQHIWSKAEADKDNKLYILHLGIAGEGEHDFSAASQQGSAKLKGSPTAKSYAALLAAAQAEAAAWSLNSVEMWNPTSVSLAAAQLLDADVSVQHRESSSITSLLWLGDGSQDIDWICNERYGWN